MNTHITAAPMVPNHASREHQVGGHMRASRAAPTTHWTRVNLEMHPPQGPLHMLLSWPEIYIPLHHWRGVKISFENPLVSNLRCLRESSPVSWIVLLPLCLHSRWSSWFVFRQPILELIINSGILPRNWNKVKEENVCISHLLILLGYVLIQW